MPSSFLNEIRGGGGGLTEDLQYLNRLKPVFNQTAF